MACFEMDRSKLKFSLSVQIVTGDFTWTGRAPLLCMHIKNPRAERAKLLFPSLNMQIFDVLSCLIKNDSVLPVSLFILTLV